MTKAEQVEEIFSKLEDDVSDLNEDAAIFVSKAKEKILDIVALLETKIELMPVILKEACKMDDVILTNIIVEALKKNENN